MKCPTCGKAMLVRDTRDLPYTYKGESTVLPGITGHFCPACGEQVLDATESRRVLDLMLVFNRQVDVRHCHPDSASDVEQAMRLIDSGQLDGAIERASPPGDPACPSGEQYADVKPFSYEAWKRRHNVED